MAEETNWGIAVKSGAEGVLDIDGLPLGTDRQGQTFTADTNVDLNPGDRVPLYFYHGFAETKSDTVQKIGEAVYQGLISGAHKFKGYLDLAIDKAKSIWADAVAGKGIPVSSDSAGHLVRPTGILGKPGTVTNWPIFALSLMDAGSHVAINPRAVAFAAAKAFMQEVEELDKVSGEAAKAGQTFAKRNRDRLMSIKAMLDEMMTEFPDTPGGEMTGAASDGKQVESKALATKADVLELSSEQIKALVASLADAAIKRKLT
jgi:hypothetical protein